MKDDRLTYKDCGLKRSLTDQRFFYVLYIRKKYKQQFVWGEKSAKEGKKPDNVYSLICMLTLSS